MVSFAVIKNYIFLLSFLNLNIIITTSTIVLQHLYSNKMYLCNRKQLVPTDVGIVRDPQLKAFRRFLKPKMEYSSST